MEIADSQSSRFKLCRRSELDMMDFNLNSLNAWRLPLRSVSSWAVVLVSLLGGNGCRVQQPGGVPISAEPLGSVVDQANLLQERNAEDAKLVVYAHEFELNQPIRADETEAVPRSSKQGFEYEFEDFVRGFRLTPYGQDHVRQIANILLTQSTDIADPEVGIAMRNVVVERSETSRRWKTNHHYPVHFNPQLDDLRRRIVVDALLDFGVADAEQRVLIGPAFSEGLNATEAARAYVRSLQSTGGGQSSGANMSGGRF